MTSKDVNNLVINKVENREVYNYMVENNLINDDELYLIEHDDSNIINDELSSDTSTYSSNKVDDIIENIKIKSIINNDEYNLQSLELSSYTLKNWIEHDNFKLIYDFYGGKSIIYNNELHLLGSNNSAYNLAHYKLTDSGWIKDIDLPNTIMSCAVCNNELYILLNNNKVYKYNVDSWELICNYCSDGILMSVNNELYCSYCKERGSIDYTYALKKLTNGSFISVENSDIYIMSSEQFAFECNNKMFISDGYNGLYHWNDSKWIKLDIKSPIRLLRVPYVSNGNIVYIFSSDYKKWTIFNGETFSEINTELPIDDTTHVSIAILNDNICMLNYIMDDEQSHFYECLINVVNKITDIKTSENKKIQLNLASINDDLISDNTTYSSDKINTLMENTPTAGLKLSKTLSSGQTTITFTDSQITTSSKLDAVYTSKFGIRLKSAEFNNGNIVLEFLPQNEDIDVMIVLNASLPPNDNNNETEVKSAYQYAIDGGFEGTEEEFTSSFADSVNKDNVEQLKKLATKVTGIEEVEGETIADVIGFINDNYSDSGSSGGSGEPIILYPDSDDYLCTDEECTQRVAYGELPLIFKQGCLISVYNGTAYTNPHCMWHINDITEGGTGLKHYVLDAFLMGGQDEIYRSEGEVI